MAGAAPNINTKRFMQHRIDPILQPILQSPHLPTYVRELQRMLLEEDQKRLDFYEWLDEDKKAEFILGELVIHSPARNAHILTLQNLEFLLLPHVRNVGGALLREQAMVRLERSDLMPDLAYWPKGVSASFTLEMKLFPTPLFVVEVLSPSTERNDRGSKMTEYAANGVKEYWLVSPEQQTIEQYQLEYETFNLRKKYTAGQSVECIALQGLTIPIEDIFRKWE